ncbi:tyrosine-type recombinase/integrase [Pseudomonas sp. 58 R 12]|uniref:tyrosine-type recombinase/integrase n=1 Tax=Pseudomonas sp. 58 R 12 TaxID=1844107 RepID=UPI000811E13B|nr:tyrosine-type recombinase/integrase [Pseudomonas sp. 58 R 12]CRM13204.1 Site-specific recombinase XerC [Pseudomonas sp. 58 R 12]
MRRKNAANLDLPPRMIRRNATLKSGKIWTGYYYNGRDANGKRKEIPLGGDLDQAKVEWARLERRAPPKPNHLLGALFDRYVKEIIPTKGLRTQSDNMKELKQLRKAFEKAPIDSITPQIVAQYRDARTAKVRANREIALLSHIFTIAREWGLTSNANPCFGVRRNKEKPRDYYAGEIVWNAVYTEAVQELKDAMDLAYLTGQRPADVLKVATTDLSAGFLMVNQGKTEKKLRLQLEEAGVQSALSAFINDLQERRALSGIKTSRLITNTSGLRMSQQMLRNRWDEAREKAAIKAGANGDSALAILIRQFQFKDIRPKAASEIELAHASRLLGHSTEDMTKKVYRRVGEIVKPTK